MKDILENQIVCCKCNKETIRGIEIKNGFKLRIFKCPQCNSVWYHPTDLRDYEEFKKLREKKYQVKLRMVGNSYAVSIPKEIIRFEQISKTKIVSLSLEGPNKIGLFLEKAKRIMEDSEDENQ